MLGSIAGDVIGSAYEFRNTKDYNFKLFSSPLRSNYTDDTVMSIAVAMWLWHCRGCGREDYLLQQLENEILWTASKYHCPVGGYGGAFRKWLFRPSLLPPFDDKYGPLPYESVTGRHPYGSWGNGSAMRVSACGWFYDTLEETERVAALSAVITHNHPEGIKGAQATAAAIWMARSGRSKAEIKAYIESKYGYDLSRTYEYLNRTYEWDSSCQGTVPEAIIAFLESTDFEDAIRKAVSMGGDSDTLACITGGIAEAFYGGVPKHILKEVCSRLPDLFKNVIHRVGTVGSGGYNPLYTKYSREGLI